MNRSIFPTPPSKGFFHSIFRRAGICALIGGLSMGFTGCSDPQKEAIRSLEEKRYAFTVEDLMLAAEAGDLEAIRLFREAGQDLNAADAEGNTALMRAAAGGRIELVDILLAAGGDPRAANGKGRTPLMFAAEKGRVEILRTLLTRGADVAAADPEGWSALKLAAYEGHGDAVGLLASRVEQSALDQVLLVASFKGDPEVIAQVLKRGAYVNTRSPDNLTPLMIAASAGYLEAVKMLIRQQANPYALDDEEHTAANLADAAGHAELRDFLLDPTALLEVVESGVSTPDAGTVKDPAMSEAEIVKTLGALVGEAPSVVNADAKTASSGLVASGTTPAAGSAPTTEAQTVSGAAVSVPNSGGAAVAGASTAASVPQNGEGRALASINGRVLESATAEGSAQPVASLKMQSYREAPLPIMLKGVESSTGTAQVRVLSGRDQAPVAVREGEVIAGTSYKVTSMDSKFISSKMGKGTMVDVSQVMVEDTRSGAKHLLIKDVPGRSGDTYATLTLPGSPFEYVVKNGDVFRAMTKEGGEQDYEVLDVRPTQVVIRNVSTDEVVTVNREGIAMR